MSFTSPKATIYYVTLSIYLQLTLANCALGPDSQSWPKLSHLRGTAEMLWLPPGLTTICMLY